jgi:cytoskeleton protein RodZ
LLRQARVAKGLHVAALAASIKVAPRKLELLEADRYDELPGAAFTRALAQTVCRSLKVDSTPVLALLPQPAGQGLSHMSVGLNAPFRDKPGHRVPSDLAFVKSPVLVGAGVLVAASLLLYLLPAGWVAWNTQPRDEGSEPASVSMPSSIPAVSLLPLPASATPSDTTPAASVAPTLVADASAVEAAPPASAIASAPVEPNGALLLRAKASSWVEVIDGRGNALLSRLLEPGETVSLDGPTPLRVKIGNAAGTQVSFHGRSVELAPSRDNVAKLELR